MTPTLKLGPWDSPALELLPEEINPIIAVMLDGNSPLNKEDTESVATFLQLDTLFLDRETSGFFKKMELTCQSIVSGESKKYDPTWAEKFGFADYIRKAQTSGAITADVRAAAGRFLDFLAINDQYWPMREDRG